MVADIELLQGKVVDDPAERIKGMAQLIEALAVELQKSQSIKNDTPSFPSANSADMSMTPPTQIGCAP